MFPHSHINNAHVSGNATLRQLGDCGQNDRQPARLPARHSGGILPDLDGLGLIPDVATRALGYRGTLYYEHYHHFLLHGIYGGIAIAVLLAGFGRHRWRVLLLALLVFHLHLLCDFVGSRGPDPDDLWPIFYDGPFNKNWMWLWKGQWQIDSWLNRILSVVLFAWSLRIAVQRGYSFVGVFNRRLDEKFVAVLRQWAAAWKARHAVPK